MDLFSRTGLRAKRNAIRGGCAVPSEVNAVSRANHPAEVVPGIHWFPSVHRYPLASASEFMSVRVAGKNNHSYPVVLEVRIFNRDAVTATRATPYSAPSVRIRVRLAPVTPESLNPYILRSDVERARTKPYFTVVSEV